MTDNNLKGYETQNSRKEPASSQPPTTNTQFDAFTFLSKMMSPERLAKEKKDHLSITPNEIWSVCDGVIDEFKKEKNLLEVPAPVTVIGDVHGNYHDLYRALLARTNHDMEEDNKNSMNTRRFVKDRYLFLGDYIECGKQSIECICLLFAFKLCYPQKYFLLRGSRECPSMNSQDFMKSLETFSPQNAEKLHKKFNKAFSWMPLAAIVGEKIFCVHGGISPFLTCWRDIRKIKRPLLELTEDRLATDLVFSDPLDYDIVHIPTDKPTFELNYLRQKSVFYNEAAVKDFCEKFKISLIIRSHTWTPSGFRYFAEKKMITIFNSSGYKNERNHGALLKIDGKGKITIITLLPSPPKAETKDMEKPGKATNMQTECDVSTRAGMSSRAPKGSEIC